MVSSGIPFVDITHARANHGAYLVLDARERVEFEVSHLAGSVWLGFDQPDWSVLDAWPRDTKILVYCSVGLRSSLMVEKIRAAGFSETYNLHRGIFGWVNRGFPIVNNKEQRTDRIHCYNRLFGTWVRQGKKVY